MGIRQTLNERPALAVGLAISFIAIAIAMVVWQIGGSRQGTSNAGGIASDQDYFSDDDGKSYFADSKTKFAPFMHNGKAAYLAGVFRCGEKGTPFVAYLGKYPDDVRQRLEAELKGGSSAVRVGRIASAGMLVKKPGQAKWVSPGEMDAYTKITDVTCPNNEPMVAVTPSSP